MRLTYHNGRAGRDGVYSTRHNDRNYDVFQDDHIDDEQTQNNIYWHCYQNTEPGLTFDEAEKFFYESHFLAALDERNERSKKQGHYERVQTIDDYRHSRKSCPEETEYAIGKLGDSVNPNLLQAIVDLHQQYLELEYPQYRVLNVALHVDEMGVGHIHERHVWIAHDDDGREIVHQAKSLSEMGVERPDAGKKEGRHNNAKMTFTARCRQNLFELCAMHGLELETEPKERSKSGLSLLEYQARQEQEKALKAKAEAEAAKEKRQLEELALNEQRAELQRVQKRIKQMVRDEEKRVDQARQEQKEARNAVVSMLRELGNVTSATDLATWQQALANLGKEIGYRVQLPNLQQTEHQR